KFAGRAKRGYRISRGNEFHSHVVRVIQLADFAENVRVIDFPGAGFVTAWNVRDVQQANDIKIFFEFGDEVAFSDLLVKKIVEEFDTGMGDFAHDLKAFSGGSEKVFGIFDGVDIFEKDFHILRGGCVAQALKGID